MIFTTGMAASVVSAKPIVTPWDEIAFAVAVALPSTGGYTPGALHATAGRDGILKLPVAKLVIWKHVGKYAGYAADTEWTIQKSIVRSAAARSTPNPASHSPTASAPQSAPSRADFFVYCVHRCKLVTASQIH